MRKNINTLLLTGLFIGLWSSASGQELTTISAPNTSISGYSTNQYFSLPEGQVMRVLYGHTLSAYPPALIAMRDGTEIMRVSPELLDDHPGSNTGDQQRDFIIAGPADVFMRSYNGGGGAFTIEMSPAQFPPGKTAVIGERDGPMKCTLEESTDLVNWTQSTSGATHSLTNANAKKFFRIRLDRDVGP